MAGYTESFISTDGDLINANLFEQEYAAISTAFNSGGGHKHDGTAGEGAKIPLIADSTELNEVLCSGSDTIIFSVNDGAVKTSQLSIANGAILPTLDNDIDLGSAALKFKNIHSSGTANLTTVDVTGTADFITIASSGLATLSSLDVTTTADLTDLDVTGNTTLADLTIASSTTVTGILNDGSMTANSAVSLVTQSSIVTYVASEIGAATLDGGTF